MGKKCLYLYTAHINTYANLSNLIFTFSLYEVRTEILKTALDAFSTLRVKKKTRFYVLISVLPHWSSVGLMLGHGGPASNQHWTNSSCTIRLYSYFHSVLHIDLQ